jgi:hypothetical protein
LKNTFREYKNKNREIPSKTEFQKSYKIILKNTFRESKNKNREILSKTEFQKSYKIIFQNTFRESKNKNREILSKTEFQKSYKIILKNTFREYKKQNREIPENPKKRQIKNTPKKRRGSRDFLYIPHFLKKIFFARPSGALHPHPINILYDFAPRFMQQNSCYDCFENGRKK